MRLARAAAILVLSLTATLDAQPLRVGDPFPLPNTRYGEAPGAPKLVAAGDALYVFWSSGVHVRMARVVEGERRGGVAVVAVRPQSFVSNLPAGTPNDFDVVWTGTHFVVAANSITTDRRAIVTRAVGASGEPLSGTVTVVANGYDPVLATNGRSIMMLYTVIQPDGRFDTMALPLTLTGRPTTNQAVDLGDGIAKAIASNGNNYLAALHHAGDVYVTTLDDDAHLVPLNLLTRDEVRDDGLAVTSNGRAYLVVTNDSDRIAADAVDAAGKPTSRTVVAVNIPTPSGTGFYDASVAWTGTGWAVVYGLGDTNRPDEVHVAMLDPSAARVTSRESVEGTPTGSTIALGGTALTSWWPGHVYTTTPVYSPLPLAQNIAQELTFKAADQILAATASSNSAVLTVWQERIADRSTLRAGVRTATGEWRERLLSDLPQIAVMATTDGTNFAVLAVDNAGKSTAYLLNEQTGFIRSPIALPFRPESVASNGETYAFVGGRQAARLSPSGVLSAAVNYADSSVSTPAITSDGTNFLVAWGAEPNCQFLLCLTAYGINAVRLGSDLRRLDASDIVLAPRQSEVMAPLVEWNGRDYVIVWTDLESGLNNASVPRTGGSATVRVVSARTSLVALDLIDYDGGVMMVVNDFNEVGNYRAVLIHLDPFGRVTQRNTFTHTTPLTGGPRLARLADGRLGYLVSQFVEDAPQHGSSHVLMLVETPPSPPAAPEVTAVVDDRNVRVNWTAAAGAVNGYRLEYRIGDGSWNELERWFGPTERAATIRLSRIGERAAFRVRAWGDGGTSSYSAAVPVNVPRRRAVR